MLNPLSNTIPPKDQAANVNSVSLNDTSTTPIYTTSPTGASGGVVSATLTLNTQAENTVFAGPTSAGLGPISSLGSITAGTLYTAGTYTGVSLTGGTGTGAKGTVVVSGGAVTSVTVTTTGSGYAVADTLSAGASTIGGNGIATTSTLVGGLLYTAGTYTAVPLTGGTGAGALATIVVTVASVSSVTITTPGIGYTVSDVLSAAAANIGGTGSGFTVTVASVQGSGFSVPVATIVEQPTFRSLVAADLPPVTNLAGGAVGSIPYQSAAGATTFLADVATGSVLTSGGVATAPAYSSSPTISGTLTLGTLSATTINGAALSGTFTGTPTLSGNVAFTGTPTFSNAVALGSSTATTQTGYNDSTKLATTAYVDNMLGATSMATASFKEDWLSSAPIGSVTTAAALAGDSPWTIIEIVAAAAVTQTTGTFTNQGMITITTGTTSGYGASIYKSGNGAGVAILGALTGNAGWEINFYGYVSSTANICVRFGFCIAGQNAGDSPTAGLYVEYDTANTGNTATGYTVVARLASSSTYPTGGNTTAPSTSTPDHIRMYSTTPGTIVCTLNGSTIGTATTGYPSTSTALMPFFQVLTRTNGAKALTMDAVSYMAATGRT